MKKREEELEKICEEVLKKKKFKKLSETLKWWRMVNDISKLRKRVEEGNAPVDVREAVSDQ